MHDILVLCTVLALCAALAIMAMCGVLSCRSLTGINGSSEGIVGVLVRGDTASALNISLGSVQVSCCASVHTYLHHSQTLLGLALRSDALVCRSWFCLIAGRRAEAAYYKRQQW